MLGLEKVVWFLNVVAVLLVGVEAKKKALPSCTQCKEIAKHFEEGLKKTAKANYGGGNTNWEEKSLGKYAKSFGCREKMKMKIFHSFSEKLLNVMADNTDYTSYVKKESKVKLCNKDIAADHDSTSASSNLQWHIESISTNQNLNKNRKIKTFGGVGAYTSEVRLVEIIDEHLCSGGSKECHQMLEEYEDAIESFWFKVYAKSDKINFHQWFCIDTVKACCPENHYGPDCTGCSGGSRPCYGNGNCDGSGTRGGTGKCSCHSGYSGTLCDDCVDGYFESLKNDTHTVCKPCHLSCKNTCWEEGPKGCDECNTGWLPSEEHGCQDIDECAVEEPPCKKGQYCINTAGSYSCFSCNEACDGCSGQGPDKCDKCNDGFTLKAQTCIDNDECQDDPTLCTGKNERCKNEPGTYSCECIAGYWRESGKCVPKPKEEADKKDEKEDIEEEEDDGEDKDDDNEEEEPPKDILPPMPLPKIEL